MTQSLDLRSKWYPLRSTAAQTLTIRFIRRPNQGTGTYITWAEMPSLVFAFANGLENAMPVDLIRSTILTHLLNNNIQNWWQPQAGAVESVLREMLETSFVPIRVGTAESIDVGFDGQFGPVFCG